MFLEYIRLVSCVVCMCYGLEMYTCIRIVIEKIIMYSACAMLSPISHIRNLRACPGENYYDCHQDTPPVNLCHLPNYCCDHWVETDHLACIPWHIATGLIILVQKLFWAVYDHRTGLDWITGLPLELEVWHYNSILVLICSLMWDTISMFNNIISICFILIVRLLYT